MLKIIKKAFVARKEKGKREEGNTPPTRLGNRYLGVLGVGGREGRGGEKKVRLKLSWVSSLLFLNFFFIYIYIRKRTEGG